MLNENRTTRAIVQYCSARDALHVPPEHRRFRRVHGLQPPLHPQQIVGWVLLVVIFAGTFTVLLTTPILRDLRLVLSLLFAALLLSHVSAHLTVVLLDPADPEVRARPTGEVVPEFDRTKHRHVIENGRCHLCNITTRGRRVKHCSICNKCVPRFDHHCKWLNNCIGSRNYPAFLACLVSTLVAALSVTALALGELVLVNVNLVVDNVVDNERNSTNNKSNGTSMNNATTPSLSSSMPGTGSLVLVTIIGVLSTVAAILLIHLCFFHGYIACLGLTTYEYVRRKRERNATGTVGGSRTQSSRSSGGGPCGASCCIDGNDENAADQRAISARGLYSRFCGNSAPFKLDPNRTKSTTDVFVCSTQEDEETRSDSHASATTNGKSVCTRTLSSMKGSRNFHLCFSYDARTTETSIEVSSSRTTTMMDVEMTETESKNHKGSPDAKSSSTPSPVSCCFSIMNHPESRHGRNDRRRRSTSEHRSEPAKSRSCGTMRRIQTFLQARLRKSSKQRSASPSLSLTSIAGHRHRCGNKIIPQVDSPPGIAPIITGNRDHEVVEITSSSTTESRTLPHNPRPPARLPALDLPGIIHGGIGEAPSPIIPSKRNQVHLCTRRSATNLSRKRPRFKVGSHIVTQTAQLSPIPESEFSKPATPRSPSRSDSAFGFPPLRE